MAKRLLKDREHRQQAVSCDRQQAATRGFHANSLLSPSSRRYRQPCKAAGGVRGWTVGGLVCQVPGWPVPVRTAITQREIRSTPQREGARADHPSSPTRRYQAIACPFVLTTTHVAARVSFPTSSYGAECSAALIVVLTQG